MKRIFIILCSTILVLSSAFRLVYAEDTSPPIDSEIIEESGGYVKSIYSVTSCKKKSESWKYVWLTSSWAKASKYSYTQEISRSSTNEISCGINAQITKCLSANYNIKYNTTVTYKGSATTEFKADSSRYSKLRWKYKVNTYDIKVKYVVTTYDTSLGYKDTTYYYNGTITIPQKGESYVYVSYKS